MLGNDHPYSSMLKPLINGDEGQDYVCMGFVFVCFCLSSELNFFSSVGVALSLVVVGWLM